MLSIVTGTCLHVPIKCSLPCADARLMCCPCIPSALPAAAQLGYSTPIIVTGRPAPAGLRLSIVSSLSSCTRFRRVRGDKGVASLPAAQGQSLRMQRRSRRAVYSANLLSDAGAPGAAGAAKGQSLRRVGSDGESMDRRSWRVSYLVKVCHLLAPDLIPE